MNRSIKSIAVAAAILALATIPVMAAQVTAPPQPPPSASNQPREPSSVMASNILAADTHSDIAPSLPATGLNFDASPGQFLRNARTDLVANQTGAAQQALEMAETRMLDRSVLADKVGAPDHQAVIEHVSSALRDLGAGNTSDAILKTDSALAGLGG